MIRMFMVGKLSNELGKDFSDQGDEQKIQKIEKILPHWCQ